MKKKLLNSEIFQKIDLLLTTFAIALLIMLVINLLVAIISLQDLLIYTDFDRISFSTQEGYYFINDYRIEVSIPFSIIGTLVLWALMLWHTLKTINKSVVGFL